MRGLQFVRIFLAGALMLHSVSGHAADVSRGSENVVAKRNLSTGSLAPLLAQVLIVTQNMCISYAYDQNGNRLSQTKAAFGAQQSVWGATTYPCFAWNAN